MNGHSGLNGLSQLSGFQPKALQAQHGCRTIRKQRSILICDLIIEGRRGIHLMFALQFRRVSDFPRRVYRLWIPVNEALI